MMYTSIFISGDSFKGRQSLLNPNNTDIQGATESIHINGVSISRGFNLVKM